MTDARVGLLAWLLTATVATAAGRGPSGPDLIIPQPREMKVLGAAVPLRDARILLTSAEPKLAVGAEEINQRLTQELAAQPLPVVRGGLNELSAASGITIVLGVAGQGTMPAIQAAHSVQVPAQHEGYGIATHKRGGAIVMVLCGHDAQGALYAAVTCRHLLETPGGAVPTNGQVELSPVTVSDWPDFPWRRIGRPPSKAGGSAWELLRARNKKDAKTLAKVGTRFVAEGKPYVDFMLRHKINLSWSPLVHFLNGSGEECEYMRALSDYARARGVYYMESIHTNIGKYPQDKDDPRKSRCVDHRVHKSYFCWTLLDVHEERARRFADLMKRAGIHWIYIHACDGGGWENPGKWNDRCEHCRAKYGDDHAAADNDVFRTYYRIMKEQMPDFRMTAVVYPYSGNKIDPELLEKDIIRSSGNIPNARELAEQRSAELMAFMTRLGKLLPRDVFICQRETYDYRYALMTKCYGDLPFEIYMEHKPGHGWNPEFSIGSGVLKTFFRPGYQDLYYSPDCSWGINYESEMMAAQYGWNVNSPGARMMGDRHGGSEITRHIEPREAALKHIERVSNNFYGREIGPYMGPVYDSNISYKFIVRPETFVQSHNLTNAPAMMQEMEAATKRALDSIEQARVVYDSAIKAGRKPIPSEAATMRFGELYRALVVSRYVSQYQSRMLAAKPAVIAGDMETAKRLMAEARQIIAAGKQAWNERWGWMRSNPCTPRRNPNFVWTFGQFYEWDYAPLEETVATFEKEMDAMFERFNAPKWFKTAIRERALYAVPCSDPPTIDGRLSEPAWEQAYRNEHFVNHKTSTPAERETEGRLLYDDTGLYVGFTAYDPGADRIQPTARKREDHGWNQSHSVELFIDSNSDGRTYQHYIWGADGSFLDSRKKEEAGGRLVLDGKGFSSRARYVVARHPDRWTVEAWIPAEELGTKPKRGGTWRANLCRNLVRSDGKRESASTVVLDGAGFHTPSKFAELHFLKTAPAQPAPIITFNVTKGQAGGVTIADGTGYEVVLDLDFDTTRPLHEASLRVDAFSGNARKATVTVFEKQDVQLLYRTRTPVHVLAGTPEPGLHLDFVLTAKEGSWTFRRQYGEPKSRTFAAQFAPGVSGQALAGLAHFSALHEGVPLFDSRQGTLEMWVHVDPQPRNTPRFGPPPSQFLFFQGPVRWDYPNNDNQSALSLKIVKGRLNGVLSTGEFQSLTARGSVGPPADGGWHHVAAQWSAAAAADLSFEIYVDGKQVSGKAKPNLRDRDWRKDAEPFFVQLGAAITGAGPLGWPIDEVRVSAAPRYTGDFTPPKRAELDSKATVVFHFDGDLNGQVHGGRDMVAGAGAGAM
ncbi:MAG: hypothetical protein JXR37_33235 [Kiritimatiellae bacterium]|nr:hypothetical protein [Kiritimatiellia bacterium]